MNNIYHIKDNIYLSNLISAQDINNINSKNINIVIRLSENENEKIYNNLIQFYNFKIEDNHSYKKEIIDLCKDIYTIIINNPLSNILIHCNEGKSRSVSVIIYYLCTKYNYNYNYSYNFIKNIKYDIRINNAFSFELRKLFDQDCKYYDHNNNIDYNNENFDHQEWYTNECMSLL